MPYHFFSCCTVKYNADVINLYCQMFMCCYVALLLSFRCVFLHSWNSRFPFIHARFQLLWLVCAGRCYIFALCGTPDGVPFQIYQPFRVTSGVTCPVRSGISGNSDFQSIRPCINAYEVKISLINAYSSMWLTLWCLITVSSDIITPSELLVNNFFLTFHK